MDSVFCLRNIHDVEISKVVSLDQRFPKLFSHKPSFFQWTLCGYISIKFVKLLKNVTAEF